MISNCLGALSAFVHIGDPVDIGDLRQAMGLTELEVRMLLFKCSLNTPASSAA